MTSVSLKYFRDFEKYCQIVCKNVIKVSVLFLSCSPSVGYLQPPSSEQYQITQSPSPCNAQQLQQQYTGLFCFQVCCISRFSINIVMRIGMALYAGVPPPGPGVMVMQLSVPNGPQPSQNPPLVQWNPCKYYSIEQRPGKPGDLYKPDNTPQVRKNLHQCTYSVKEFVTKTLVTVFAFKH